MVTVTHAKVVSTPDDGTSDVGSDEWNADHVVTGVRELLTGTRTYYVRTDGSDSNTGLTNTAGGAFLTIQKAYDVIESNLDLGGFQVTIQIGAGTYTAGLSITEPWTGGGSIRFTGDLVTPSNVIVDNSGGDTIKFSNMVIPGPVYFGGLKILSAGYGLYNNAAGAFIVDGLMEYGAVTNAQIVADSPGGSITLSGNYTINGGAAWHLLCETNAEIVNAAAAVTVSGTPAFSTQFAAADDGGVIYSFATFTGSATGTRYLADTNAVINTFGAGANYFPGDVAGSVTNGGQYV